MYICRILLIQVLGCHTEINACLTYSGCLPMCNPSVNYFVRLYVRPSVRRVNCDKIKETLAHIIISYERSIALILRHKVWLMGDVPLYLRFWAKMTCFFKNAELQSVGRPICLSARYTLESCLTVKFPKYNMHHKIGWCLYKFLDTKFHSCQFSDSPKTSVLNGGTSSSKAIV